MIRFYLFSPTARGVRAIGVRTPYAGVTLSIRSLNVHVGGMMFALSFPRLYPWARTQSGAWRWAFGPFSILRSDEPR